MALLDKLEITTGSVLSIVGSGGKTTLMYALARECARAGKKVAVTTTTHILYPDEPDLPVFQNVPPLRPGTIAVAGQPAGEKLASPSQEVLDRLAKDADVLLIEADGSRRLPIKFPRAGEPVLIPQTSCILLVVGLSGLGQPCAQVCHRWGLAQKALNLPYDTVMAPDILAKLLICGYGQLSPTPQVILNQTDTLSSSAIGEELRQLLLPHFPCVTLLSLHQEVDLSC